MNETTEFTHTVQKVKAILEIFEYSFRSNILSNRIYFSDRNAAHDVQIRSQSEGYFCI